MRQMIYNVIMIFINILSLILWKAEIFYFGIMEIMIIYIYNNASVFGLMRILYLFSKHVPD